MSEWYRVGASLPEHISRFLFLEDAIPDRRVLVIGESDAEIPFSLLELGATKVVCAVRDEAQFRLLCQEAQGPGVDVRRFDGGLLPADDGAFDLVVDFELPVRMAEGDASRLDDISRVLSRDGFALCALRSTDARGLRELLGPEEREASAISDPSMLTYKGLAEALVAHFGLVEVYFQSLLLGYFFGSFDVDPGGEGIAPHTGFMGGQPEPAGFYLFAFGNAVPFIQDVSLVQLPCSELVAHLKDHASAVPEATASHADDTADAPNTAGPPLWSPAGTNAGADDALDDTTRLHELTAAERGDAELLERAERLQATLLLRETEVRRQQDAHTLAYARIQELETLLTTSRELLTERDSWLAACRNETAAQSEQITVLHRALDEAAELERLWEIEVARAQGERDSARRRQTHAEQASRELRSQLESVEAAQERATVELQLLREEQEEAQRSAGKLQELTHVREALEQNLQEAHARIQSAAQALSMAEERCAAAEEECAALREERDDFRRELTTQLSGSEIQQTRYAQLEAEHQRLVSQLREATEREGAHQQAITALESTQEQVRERLRSQLAEKNGDLEKLARGVRTLVEERDALQEALTAQRAAQEQAVAALRSHHDVEVSDLRAAWQEQERARTAQYDEAAARLSDMEARCQAAEATIAEQSRELGFAQAALQESIAQRNTLQSIFIDKEGEIERLQARLREVVAENEHLQGVLDATLSVKHDLEGELATVAQSTRELRQESQEWRSRFDEAQQVHGRDRKQRDEREAVLQQTLEATKVALDEIRSERDHLLRDLDSAREAVRDEQHAGGQARSELASQRQQYEVLREQMQKAVEGLEQALASERQDVARLRDELHEAASAWQRRAQEYEDQLWQSAAAKADAEQRADQLAEELDVVTHTLDEQANELAALAQDAARVEELGEDNSKLRQTLAHKEAALEVLRAESKALREEASAALTGQEEGLQRLTASERLVAVLRERAEAENARFEAERRQVQVDAEQRVAAEALRGDSLSVELEEAQGRLHAEHVRAESYQAELAEAQSRLAIEYARAEGLSAELEEAQGALAREHARAHESGDLLRAAQTLLSQEHARSGLYAAQLAETQAACSAEAVDAQWLREVLQEAQAELLRVNARADLLAAELEEAQHTQKSAVLCQQAIDETRAEGRAPRSAATGPAEHVEGGAGARHAEHPSSAEDDDAPPLVEVVRAQAAELEAARAALMGAVEVEEALAASQTECEELRERLTELELRLREAEERGRALEGVARGPGGQNLEAEVTRLRAQLLERENRIRRLHQKLSDLGAG